MWEYKTETFICTFDSEKRLKEKSNKILEHCGKEGWELVNFRFMGILSSIMIFVFKREKNKQ